MEALRQFLSTPVPTAMISGMSHFIDGKSDASRLLDQDEAIRLRAKVQG